MELGPRGVMDNIFVFGTKDRGSSPLEGTERISGLSIKINY